jgi:hypothetical protein
MPDYNAISGAGSLAGLAQRCGFDAVVSYQEITIVSDEPDTTDPVIENITPAPRSAISKDAVVTFDAVDNTGLLVALVYIVFSPRGDYELVYDGSVFTPLYSRYSSIDSIEGGLRFSLRRWGGWPGALQIRVRAIDSSGNVST